MGWRTVVVESPCKLSYKNEHMLIRGEKDVSVFIPEIDTLIVATTQCVTSGVLVCELLKNKVNILLCDEKHNPCSQIMPVYGCHNSSKKIAEQTKWTEENKAKAFSAIVKQKILNQSAMLKKADKLKESEMLKVYASEVTLNDVTNREGFAAKVYFNALFGLGFTRDKPCGVNAALNYGYTVLLSCFNREVAAAGYLTQFGIRHCNDFNQFNYSCDLIEPFRVIIDNYVYFSPPGDILTGEYKRELVSLLQTKVNLEKEYFLSDAIGIFVRRMSEAVCTGNIESVKMYEF